MMQNCLQAQIRRNIQVYVDDIVIMTKEDSTFLDDCRGFNLGRLYRG